MTLSPQDAERLAEIRAHKERLKAPRRALRLDDADSDAYFLLRLYDSAQERVTELERLLADAGSAIAWLHVNLYTVGDLVPGWVVGLCDEAEERHAARQAQEESRG